MDKTQFYKKVPAPRQPVSWTKVFQWSGIIAFIAVIALGFYIKYVIIDKLPSLEQLENPPQELATRILDSEGNLIENFYIKRRMYVPYDSIASAFFDALISTEDHEFYNHWGVHAARIFKASIKNVFAGRAKEGASTITQQLARNLYFTQEATINRKLREAFTAVQIERTYTKHEILEMYANTVNFGRGAYGIQVASQLFFAKQPKDLSVPECAYFVALLKAPTSYDARENYDKALRRRNTVLALMRENGCFDQSMYSKYADEQLRLVESSHNSIGTCDAPHFVEMIRKKLSRDERLKGYDLYRDGLTIYTTLNSRIQRYANDAVREQLATFQKEFDKAWSWKGKQDLLNAIVERAAKDSPLYIGADGDAKKKSILNSLSHNARFIDSVKRVVTTVQCGLTVIEPATGAILAMVGASPLSMQGVSGAKYSLNHCTEVRRQPGSSFKPFVYASAIGEKHLTPTSEIESGPFSYTLPSGDVWTPKSGRDHSGPITLATALKFSVNTVAARLITEYTSPDKVISVAKHMGISTPMDPFPSLALGAQEVYPIDMTAAYGVFVNQGIAVQPVSILKIEDRRGTVLYENKVQTGLSDALDPSVCRTMVTIMRGVVDGGTASTIRKFYKYDAAGKTGTTNDYADAWFVGYTPQLVAGVWLGFDDHRVKFTGTYGMGGKAAAPIWGRLMAKIYEDPRTGYREKLFPARDSSIERLDPSRIPDYMPEDQLPTDPPEPEQNTAPAQPHAQAIIPQAKPSKPALKFPSLKR